MELLQKVFQGGVVGAGGAGFPTHKKLVENAELLIVNAAECEPLLCSDRYVMRRFAGEIIGALLALRRELHIGRVVIGTKAKYHEEIEALRLAIEEHGAGDDIAIHTVGSFYPAGDEQALIYEVTGRTVPPGGIPLALGIVVINVTTALNIYDALHGKPVVEKYVTVNGAVQNPCIVRVPVGTPVADCIEAAGGALPEEFIVVMGGPMMGRQHPMSHLGELFIQKTSGGVLVLPAQHCLPAYSKKSMEHIINQAKSVCIQCSCCTQLCPRYLIGHPLRPHRVMRAVASGQNARDLTEAMLCCECGICELYACPMLLSPRQVNIHVKGLLREAGVKPEFSVYPDQSTMREYRRIAQSRLIARLDLSRYPTSLETLVEHAPAEVTIPLKQGVGKPSQAAVAVGDRVQAGDVIGRVEFSDVGSMIHASVPGTVTAVGNNVTIRRESEGV